MPVSLRLQNLSAHRIAAKALYRALLKQCHASPLPIDSQNELANLIRYRFKNARESQSEKRLRVAFCGAYEGLDKLDAAIAGDDASTTYILQFLSRVPLYMKQLPVSSATQEADTSPRAFIGPIRGILERPRPLSELSGRRHAPQMVAAGGIPMLRIKKPQPPALSGYIARRINRHVNRTILRHELTSQIAETNSEDAWDASIADSLPKAETAVDEPLWSSELVNSHQSVQKHLNTLRIKDTRMATKMQSVVDAERGLVRKERANRRKIARKAKKLAEREAVSRTAQ